MSDETLEITSSYAVVPTMLRAILARVICPAHREVIDRVLIGIGDQTIGAAFSGLVAQERTIERPTEAFGVVWRPIEFRN